MQQDDIPLRSLYAVQVSDFYLGQRHFPFAGLLLPLLLDGVAQDLRPVYLYSKHGSQTTPQEEPLIAMGFVMPEL